LVDHRRRRDGRCRGGGLPAADRLALTALRGLVLAIISFAVLGCGAKPPSETPTAAPAQPIQAEATDREFRLVLKANSARHAVGVPIVLTTELHYIGQQPQMQLAGSGTGLVIVSLRQLDGPLEIGGGATADCMRYSMAPGAPIVRPYAKSGGWSADDPNADFYRAYFADPLLRLPRGTWRVVATAEFFVGDCPGPSHKLDATLDLVVE
jgi:hypothetical protein